MFFDVLTTNLPQDGWTPLHCAANQGHVAVCEALTRLGSALDATSKVCNCAAAGTGVRANSSLHTGQVDASALCSQSRPRGGVRNSSPLRERFGCNIQGMQWDAAPYVLGMVLPWETRMRDGPLRFDM